MAEKSFHPFPRLPTELRLQIWRLCLPYRVWDTDLPTDEGLYIDEPNADGFYPCIVIPTAKLNGLPPVVTRVCQESRNVAKESGVSSLQDIPIRIYHTMLCLSLPQLGGLPTISG